MDKTHEFKGLKNQNMDRKHARLLLGAASCMYDDQLRIQGYNPSEIRQVFIPKFSRGCKPIDEKTFRKMPLFCIDF